MYLLIGRLASIKWITDRIRYQKLRRFVSVKMFISTVLFCITSFVSCSYLPSEIPLCKSSNEDCLKASAEIAFSKLINGNEELGIPALDPLVMDTVEIDPKAGAINIQQKYYDTTIKGITKTKVSQFSVDLENCHIFMELKVPELKINTKYEIIGQLLLLPVGSQGDAQVICKNFVIQATIGCEMFKVEDIEYLRAITSEVKLFPDEVLFNLGKLIEGNDEFDKEVHKIIDNDPKAFFEVMRPAAEESWSFTVKETVNKFFTKVPKQELFKDG